MTGRLAAVGLLVLTTAAAPVPARADGQERLHASEEAALVQLERDWDSAFLLNDTAFIDRVLAREFVAVYPDGSKGDRATELANTAAFNQKIDSSTLDDFTIQIHGDTTAVVWFRRTLVGPSKGQRLEVVYRYLDVFVRRDGRWQCVASQSVKVPA